MALLYGRGGARAHTHRQTTDRARHPHPACAKVMYARLLTFKMITHMYGALSVSSLAAQPRKDDGAVFSLLLSSALSLFSSSSRSHSRCICAALCLTTLPRCLPLHWLSELQAAAPAPRGCTQVYMLRPAANQRRPATSANASSPPPVVLARNEDRICAGEGLMARY